MAGVAYTKKASAEILKTELLAQKTRRWRFIIEMCFPDLKVTWGTYPTTWAKGEFNA